MIQIVSSYLLIFLFSFNFSNANQVKEKTYQLYKAKNQKATLILFPGYTGGGAENTKKEFKILDKAAKNNISVLLMDFDEHVFLSQKEKKALKTDLEAIFKANDLHETNIFIGGFSSGGNVTLLLSDYLVQSKSNLIPKGIFVVDSPVDLLKIYEISQKNVLNSKRQESVEESKWIVANFDKDFGNPEYDNSKYQQNAPFTAKKNNIDNLLNLKNIKIRLYSEPDLDWWKDKNGNDYEDLNAYSLSKLAETLKTYQFKNVEVINTKNKGIRANGERHPHSWSIVDVDNLIVWMRKK